MIYKGKFEITKEELKRYNDLLQLDLESDLPYYDKDTIEELNAKQDDYIGITTIEFENGNYITIDLASGNSNYYDNVVLFDKNGNELIASDCTYEINGFSLYYEEDIYDVELITRESGCK